jgi:hypothetical protein
LLAVGIDPNKIAAIIEGLLKGTEKVISDEATGGASRAMLL